MSSRFFSIQCTLSVALAGILGFAATALGGDGWADKSCGGKGGGGWSSWEPGALLSGIANSGIEVGGWVAVGSTTGNGNPTDPAAGLGHLPVGFNYRREEVQLHQLYAFAEKETETCGCGWDIGGRIDLLFGEDYIFPQAAGLETRQDGSAKWNTGAGGNGIFGTGRTGLAMPQIYGDIAYNNLLLRLGHFYSNLGYENVMAPANFFYSRSYSLLYGSPLTHTGGMLSWDVSDRLSVSYGLVNGWDKFDAVVDRVSQMAGFKWTSYDERLSLAFTLITGDEDGINPVIMGNRTMYSTVFDYKINCQWEYVFEHVYGMQDDFPIVGDSQWYGINQYLFYTINDCWKAGVRYEWFNDDDGSQIPGFPVAGFPAHWHALALGLNWSPREYIIVRPEVRWDWARAHAAGTPPGPFDDLTSRDQVLLGTDVIVKF